MGCSQLILATLNLLIACGTPRTSALVCMDVCNLLFKSCKINAALYQVVSKSLV